MKSLHIINMLLLMAPTVLAQAKDGPKPSPQNPSPMVDNSRAHERITPKEFRGIHFTLADILPKPVEIFLPQKSRNARHPDLLLHFHGASFIVQNAVDKYNGAICAAVINLGAGSSVYGNAFDDSTRFLSLLATIFDRLQQTLAHPVTARKVILSGFSAGYGAIRKIISTQQNYARVDAVLLLDGLHANYVPERRVLAEGGEIDSSGLAIYIRFAKEAAEKNSAKKFLITHSEIFPGTFVSTTEASDFILQQLGMRRKPILKWGPLGMQQLSVARRHHFEVRGFAGNTAPDHVDHLHGLYYFLNEIMKL